MGLDIYLESFTFENNTIPKENYIDINGHIDENRFNAELLKDEDFFNYAKSTIKQILKSQLEKMKYDYSLINANTTNKIKEYTERHPLMFLDHIIDTKTYTIRTEKDHIELLDELNHNIEYIKTSINQIKTLTQDEMIQTLENTDEYSNELQIYQDIRYSDVFKSPIETIEEVLYYRKEYDIVEMMEICLNDAYNGTFSNMSDTPSSINNLDYYLINDTVINHCINFLKESIDELKFELDDEDETSRDDINYTIEKYQLWLNDFKSLDQSKEYIFHIWY